MSRFFVGQRVRVIGAHSAQGRALIGKEAIVVELVELPTWGEPIYGLDLSAVELRADGLWGWAGDCLEHILPDGHRVCDEEFKRDLDKLLEGVLA